MSRIVITENGRETIVTDIAPYVAERDAIVGSLNAIYADYQKLPGGALGTREPEIVDLVNRYQELETMIDEFELERLRRDNIRAGWEIVRKHRAGDDL